MKKKNYENEALEISHRIFKEKYGILEPTPGIVSEEDLDDEWQEVTSEDFENAKKK